MATAENLLALARAELGTVEYPANSNRVKYNTAYYGREVSGSSYAWCAVFLWWLFREAGASELYYGGGKTAYCPTLLSFHRGQWVTDYRPGDIIFFNFSGKSNARHVGICESYDGTYITTIDGNTGTGDEANGGAVMRRNRHRRYIVGAYRPAYEEDTMTQEQFDQMMDNWLSRRAQEPASDWAKPYIQEAIEAGAMAEVNGTIERPQSFVTRQELATVAAALSKK